MGKDLFRVAKQGAKGLADMAVDTKLSKEIENYDALAKTAQDAGLYQQFVEAIRAAYFLGVHTASGKFVGADFLKQPDPEIAEKECTKVKGISALPDDKPEGGEA